MPKGTEFVLVYPVIHPFEHFPKQLPDRHARHQLAQYRHHKRGDVEYRQARIQVILGALAACVVIGLGIGNGEHTGINLDFADTGIKKERRKIIRYR